MEDKKPKNPYVHPIQENTLTNYGGITLRDYFANSAMQGKMSAEHIGYSSDEDIAKHCYQLADAMLKQREL